MNLERKFENYVISMIKNSVYVEDNNYTINCDRGAILLFFSVYQKEYGWAFPGVRNIKDYLQGLPSIANIDFYNYKIIEIGKDWGVNLDTEEKQYTWCETWWERIAMAIITLAVKHGVRYTTYVQKRVVR